MIEIRVCTNTQDSMAIGLHIVNPTPEDIEAAYFEAETKGYAVVWCHYSNITYLDEDSHVSVRKAL